MPRETLDPAGLVAFWRIVFLGEILAKTLIFPWIVRRFNRVGSLEESGGNGRSAAIIGMLERLFLFLALLLGVQQGLTVFAALKAGSRLDEERTHRVKTEYFLVGNVVSATLALCYYLTFPLLRHWVAGLF
jgi:hypothetical protein